MVNLLELFSTDRRLLETRGSLIIRQLCLNLNTERIYRTFAEILEKDDVRVLISACGDSSEYEVLGSRICKCHRPEVELNSHYLSRVG
jgi:hypothetical protein